MESAAKRTLYREEAKSARKRLKSRRFLKDSSLDSLKSLELLCDLRGKKGFCSGVNNEDHIVR